MVREDPTVISYSVSPRQAAAKVASGWRLEIGAYKSLIGSWTTAPRLARSRYVGLPDISNNVGPVKTLFEQTYPLT